MQTVFLCFGLAGLAVSLPLAFFAWIWRTASHPVLEALSRVRGRSVAVQLALLAFVANLIVHGSVKTNANGYAEGGTTNPPSGLPSPGMPPPPLLQPPAEGGWTLFGFTTNQLAAGFVLSEVGFGGSWNFDPPASATVVSDWRLRGAADDWRPASPFAPVSDAPAVFAGGIVQDRVRSPSLVFAPFNAPLGVVPEANWGMVAGSNAASMVWHGATPSNTFVVTWRDVLLDRDTNTPVSVQAEFFDDGGFVYRYDLGSVKCRIENGELDAGSLANVTVGAWRGGFGESLDLSSCATNPASVSSVSFRALRPEDALTADRDGDGISTCDEIFVHHTDPGLYDSDGDGIGDGDEVAQSLDPLAVSVPDEALLARLDDFQTNASYAAAYVAATNELVGYRLWDSFAATWPAGATNLVYERTVRIDRAGGWQQYYLSSRPDSAGGWSLGGMVLEWEDSCGESGTATASPAADSLYLPLSTNGPSSVTFRLRAVSSGLRSVRPVYLVGYSPAVSISGGREIVSADGRALSVFTEGSRSAIGVSIDRSRRPCKAPLHPLERLMCGISDIESQTDGGLRYEGDLGGGAIVASGAGVWRLPETAVSGMEQAPGMRGSGASARERHLVVLMPWVGYGKHHCVGDGLCWDGEEYSVQYEYPLDSGCLVRGWHRGTGGAWTCDCVPAAGCGLGDGNGFATVDLEVEGDTATATVRVCGEAIWSDSAVHVRGEDGCWSDSGIEAVGDCGECGGGCEGGDCSAFEGPALNSLKFRIPTGAPRKGQVAGFAYFETEGPVSVSPESFKYLLRGDVGASVTTNGTSRTVSCACERGRELEIGAVQDGVRVVVRKQATGALEHTWEIVNVGGSRREVRLRQISRLNNVMQDWTYRCERDEESGEWNWRATDNVSGVREELERADSLNADGAVSEVRAKYDADGGWLGEVETRSEIVGERECAVLREVYRREATMFNTVERTADYWRDTEHPARNGRLRLLRGDDIPWEYHEWSKDGFEVLRVEQRNGSAAPEEFPVAASNGFENASGLADAFLTTFSYEPPAGDDAHADDRGRARCESRYVVRDGAATLVGRTWRRYTHVLASGLAAVREETWRAHSASAQFGDAANAYSWRTAFDPVSSDGVPLVLRGETAEEMDEDGVRAVAEVSIASGRITLTRRRWRGQLQFPTCEVVETDDVHGLVLRRAKCLADGGAVVEEAVSAYDDQSRLRSVAYHDGTSETNAYSCCRLLWRRDREGRTTLRSAVTGQDGLYYAMEDVWLGDLGNGELGTGNGTNGFRVTQHFFDGLGRETNTVVYVGSTPGEATDFAAANGRSCTMVSTSYPYGTSDYSIKTDERGKVTVMSTYILGDGIASVETVYTNGVAVMYTTSSSFFNGGSSLRREWFVDCDNPIASLLTAWTEERRFEDYDADGKRIEYMVTESSDYGVVTNSVSTYDLLGRLVSKAVPGANGSAIVTANTYDGATTRVLAATYTADDVVRTTTCLYNDFGEQVGTVLDGITSREDTTYETDASNVVWKVVSSSVLGPSTNSLAIVRTRLTGLSDSCRRHMIELVGASVPPARSTETLASYNPATDIETETVTSSVAPSIVRRYRHGVLLSEETVGTTMFNAYDALGLVAATSRSIGNSPPLPVQAFDYTPCGDIMATHTYTNGTGFVTEAYGYDMLGNRITTTDALGNTVFKSYDALGNVVAEWGAAYPVRFAYDTEGRRTLLSTTRDGIMRDVTTWEYDPATGRCAAKRYADGSIVIYTYTPDNLLIRTTHASGRWMGNVYDARRRIVAVEYSDGETVSLAHDAFSNEIAASNGVAFATFDRDARGNCTNETTIVGGESKTIERKFDAFRRLTESGGTSYMYDEDGSLASVSNAIAVVEYAYTPDRLDAGYSLTLSNGVVFTRSLLHDGYCRSLVTDISSIANGVGVGSLAYAYDALNRPTSRNNDTFGYNVRGEVVFSRRDEYPPAEGCPRSGCPSRGENAEDAYSYDNIGNLLLYACNSATNTYTANNLNQYTTILRDSASPREISHDADGNMLSDGNLSFTYDAANRLKTVSSNGVLLVTNFYDAKSRRVKKVTPEATTTFFYDGWNLIEERVAYTNGTSSTISYFWGKDLSGSLQGAGGIGGLLYLTVSNSSSQRQLYVPCYDNNGNITRCFDADGNTVAQYTYDAFGKTISQSGTMSEVLHHRFSTKYFDPETGLYYYGYRFYSPTLMRWLNRDPIEEEGGFNLYGFCRNDALNHHDKLGNTATPTRMPRRPVSGWYFSPVVWNEPSESLNFIVSYTMSETERKCCRAVTVDRYVKKILRIGNRFGSYEIDHALDGGMTDARNPYVGYAEGDSPDGQTFFIYRLPWTQSFKWEARCTRGPNKGKILSTIERQFKTSGHWLWNPKREGRFL